MQPEFLATLVERCYQKGYHTCLDTCGHAPWGALEKVLEKIDLVLYDIKHMDPGKHREYTGVDNSLILENLGKIKQMNKKIIVRLPLIPKYNDDDSNITATGRFMKLWGLSRIDLLPYHNFGANKYDALAQEYPLVNTPALDKNRLNSKIEILESYGLTVEIA